MKTPDQLEREFRSRARWYCKGMGVHFQIIVNQVDILELERAKIDPDETCEREKRLLGSLEMIEELYRNIPFDEITESPDYELLLSIKNYLPILRDKITGFLREFSNADELLECHSLIFQLGQQYRARLSSILDNLNEGSENNRYRFRTSDVFGKFWPCGAL